MKDDHLFKLTQTIISSSKRERLKVAPVVMSSKIAKRKPKIALIGSRGIPGKYGGAETFVYELSRRLKKIFDVFVTCETGRFYVDEFEGIRRVHIWAFHTPTITIPSIYDVIATIYLLTKFRDIDVYYYVTPDGALAALLAKLARRRVVINSDGTEWIRLFRRMRYAPLHLKPLYILTALYMLLMEALASEVPDVTIADAIGIKLHLERLWKPKKVTYIAYGVCRLPKVDNDKEMEILRKYGLELYGYYLTIGRIVAENGIHIEIEAFKKANSRKKLVIVGPIDLRDPYVKHLIKLRGRDTRIIFTGGIYEPEALYVLRKNCFAYIHAYEVGGTNPSLLEQLQFNRPIIARDVSFHREILLDKGIYFKNSDDLAKIMGELEHLEISGKEVSQSFSIPKRYTWEYISLMYAQIFLNILLRNKK